MNEHIMKTLLWREWRWNRAIFVAGVVIFFLPYVIALVLAMFELRSGTLSGKDMEDGLFVSAIYSCVVSQLTLTVLGGNAIAGERSDRTAEFLAYLPISNLQRLAGKLAFIALIAALIWGLNWLIIGSLNESGEMSVRQLLEPAKFVAVFSFAAFGVAWFVSAIQSSPTYAVCAGIITPILLPLTILMIDSNFDLKPSVLEQIVEVALPMVYLTFGILGLGAGTWYFLKRVEP